MHCFPHPNMVPFCVCVRARLCACVRLCPSVCAPVSFVCACAPGCFCVAGFSLRPLAVRKHNSPWMSGRLRRHLTEMALRPHGWLSCGHWESTLESQSACVEKRDSRVKSRKKRGSTNACGAAALIVHLARHLHSSPSLFSPQLQQQQLATRWPDFTEVAENLQRNVRAIAQDASHPAHGFAKRITLFYVNGQDHFDRCKLARGFGVPGVGMTIPLCMCACACVCMCMCVRVRVRVRVRVLTTMWWGVCNRAHHSATR